MKLSAELIERGFVHQITGGTLSDIIDNEKRVIFHGIDPSADSAHAGNMVIWMLLRRLAEAGHKIIFLVGGATGMIGDPKPDAERELKGEAEVFSNVAKIKKQAEGFFTDYEIEFVNNYDWFKEFKLIDFLRDVGKYYTVNDLIKKDAIATRLKSDTGLSYTEFAYPLIQGFDYYQLFKTKNCTLQVGGSDQWGNLVSGVELIRRKAQAQVHAVTVPLVIDKATGKKFGKSEGNAVWLAPNKTSPYQFYQFWLNIADDSVIDYLKLFTFISLVEIFQLEQDLENNPGQRKAQKALALAVTEIVHGVEATVAVKNVSDILFGGKSLEDLMVTEKEILLANAPVLTVEVGELLVDILVKTDLASSKREARTFIESGAVVLGDKKITELTRVVVVKDFSDGVVLIRRGKKNLCLLFIK